MTIRTFTIRRAEPQPRGPIRIYAVRAAEAGTAILSCVRDAEDNLDVTAIDRLPAGLGPVAGWLHDAIPDFLALDRHTKVVIDADAYGRALFEHLQVSRRRSWVLYDKRGRDRQDLVIALLVAQREGRIHIGLPSPHEGAMREALKSYRKTVGDDGVVGGELVTALGLALLEKQPIMPRVL